MDEILYQRYLNYLKNHSNGLNVIRVRGYNGEISDPMPLEEAAKMFTLSSQQQQQTEIPYTTTVEYSQQQPQYVMPSEILAEQQDRNWAAREAYREGINAKTKRDQQFVRDFYTGNWFNNNDSTSYANVALGGTSKYSLPLLTLGGLYTLGNYYLNNPYVEAPSFDSGIQLGEKWDATKRFLSAWNPFRTNTTTTSATPDPNDEDDEDKEENSDQNNQQNQGNQQRNKPQRPEKDPTQSNWRFLWRTPKNTPSWSPGQRRAYNSAIWFGAVPAAMHVPGYMKDIVGNIIINDAWPGEPRYRTVHGGWPTSVLLSKNNFTEYAQPDSTKTETKKPDVTETKNDDFVGENISDSISLDDLVNPND